MQKLPVQNDQAKRKSIKKIYESRVRKNWGMSDSFCIGYNEVIASLKDDRIVDSVVIRDTRTSVYLEPLIIG